jgi:phage-related protein
MSQMINDTLQNIYNRLSQYGQAIAKLQTSLDALNQNLDSKVQAIVTTVTQLQQNTEKEGEAFKIVLGEAGEKLLTEIKKLQSNIGLTDLEALKPQTVDILLEEVLTGIRTLTGKPVGERLKGKATAGEEGKEE